MKYDHHSSKLTSATNKICQFAITKESQLILFKNYIVLIKRWKRIMNMSERCEKRWWDEKSGHGAWEWEGVENEDGKRGRRARNWPNR